MTVVVPLPYIRSNRKQKYKCQNQQKSFHLILLETGFSKLIFAKKLSFCNKLKFSIPTSLQIYGVNLFNNRINSLKYLRSTALDCKDIGIRKSVFVAKTQIFFVESKSRAKEHSNDVSFVIFIYQTWNLDVGGGQINTSPTRVSWFSSTPTGIELRPNMDINYFR